MGNNIIPSNLPLPNNLPANPPAQKKSVKKVVGNFFHSVAQTTKNRIRYWTSPSANPTEILGRMNEAANKGLRRAKAQNIELQPVTLHGVIDQELEAKKQKEILEVENSAHKGPVADLSPLSSDLEVTDPPLLQDRVNDPDYYKKIVIPKGKEALRKKLNAMATFFVMRSRTGQTDPNNYRILGLIQKATEGPNPPSIWKLFTEAYELSFFEKVQAGLFYWLYYKTSLVDKINEKYTFEAILDRAINELSIENSEILTHVIRSVLGNANEFLLADIQATKDFAFQRKDGNLEKYRNKAIERHYGFSLDDLCRKFSETFVEKTSPNIPIFEELQRVPLLGWFFKKFQWFVNRFIIQRAMKSFVLPHVFKEAVNKGLQATQPDNFAFATHLTRFFVRQLEQFQLELEKPPSNKTPNKPAAQVPGTEMLSATIKNLMISLELQGLENPIELRKKFESFESDTLWAALKNGPDNLTRKTAENGIIESAHLLFTHLNKTARSGELFAQLLELSLASFSASERDKALLEAEYREEKFKLERTVGSVLRKLISKTVSEKSSEFINGPKTESSQQVATKSFHAQKIVTDKVVEQLGVICSEMAPKIERSAHAPLAPENNVQTEIGSILQIMQALASRKELQEELTNIQAIDRDAVWRVLNPLFTRAEKIQERVLKLQELQDKHPAEAEVSLSLNEIKDFLSEFRIQLRTHPRHHQNTIYESVRESIEKIKRRLGARAPLYLKLQELIEQISTLSQRIGKEQQAIDAIYKLSPPREEEEVGDPQGLLNRLLNYQRGVYPKGFKPSRCLAEIKSCLAYFSPEEREELERLIGNGSNLKVKWDGLGETLQKIYGKHLALKNLDIDPLNHILDTTDEWLKNKISAYNLLKDKHYGQMQTEMRRISADVNILQTEAESAKLELSSSLPPSLFKGLSVTVPLVSVMAGSWIGLPLFIPAATSAISKWFKGLDDKTSVSFSSFIRGTTTAVAGMAAYNYEWISAPVAALGAAYMGWQGPKAAKSGIETYANDQAWKLFTKAYEFVLQPRIYKAAVTRTMKEIAEVR